MDLSQINYLAVLTAAVSCFIIGGLWYSPVLFANSWMKEASISKDEIKQTNMVKIFGLSFLLTLIITFNLAAFLGPDAGFVWGMTAGALAGIGWVAASLGILYFFERRSLKLFLINAGYLAVSFIVAGGIIGAWQ
jgi:hypothetical protein